MGIIISSFTGAASFVGLEILFGRQTVTEIFGTLPDGANKSQKSE